MPQPTHREAFQQVLGRLIRATSVIEWRSVSATVRIPRYGTWHEVVMRNVHLILDRIHFPQLGSCWSCC